MVTYRAPHCHLLSGGSDGPWGFLGQRGTKCCLAVVSLGPKLWPLSSRDRGMREVSGWGGDLTSQLSPREPRSAGKPNSSFLSLIGPGDLGRFRRECWL